MNKPVVITFEGIDGSGKETQCNLFADYLRSLGKSVLIADYPRYIEFFGKEIGLLLSGQDKGRCAKTLDPKSMALWYASDRLADYLVNKDEWAKHDFVLLNRSTLSSMVYQSMRTDDPLAMMDWVENLEFTQMGIPKPDLFLIFDVSPKSSEVNMQKKAARTYTENKLDVYEGDKEFQNSNWGLYQAFGRTRTDAALVPCEIAPGQLMPKEEILQNAKQIAIDRGLLSSD